MLGWLRRLVGPPGDQASVPTGPAATNAASAGNPLTLPLRFKPAYQTVMWGGRRMEAFRADLPAGPIGESWDLADHARGMSVVADGPLAGTTLKELTKRFGTALVGPTYTGGDFPLLVKLIDANDRLSIQVHPDDRLAKELKVGERGKTECWYLLSDGGELFVGTQAGVTKESFTAAREAGTLADTLSRFVTKPGDFFFIPARTVHALGAGCLIYEIQQTCDVTFRVDDWGRVGLDGKPRPLHIAESLATIDFTAGAGRAVGDFDVTRDGRVRALARCPYFHLDEHHARRLSLRSSSCTIVTCIGGHGRLNTAEGSAPLTPMTTVLVPAAAGEWNAYGEKNSELHLLVTTIP
ncbi:MAG: class I mannose-6-phosphate isomerase [Planctomycetes bacterium]|nr:class I mannose-6-phosphate isomerase [Planctomycetota bacterium]